MNVYVFVGGKVIEFRDSLDFEFQPISKGKGLVEVNGESGGSVVIGEGDAVLLGEPHFQIGQPPAEDLRLRGLTGELALEVRDPLPKLVDLPTLLG